MKTSLDHLPPAKQRELERVVEIVFDEFGDAMALAKHEWKKKARILKIILYGSFARGGDELSCADAAWRYLDATCSKDAGRGAGGVPKPGVGGLGAGLCRSYDRHARRSAG